MKQSIKKYGKNFTMGMVLLLSGTNMVQASPLVYQTTLNKEVGIATHSCNSYLKSGEPSFGEVVLANPTDKEIISRLTMTIVGKDAIDKQNIIQSIPSKVSIKIPAYQEVVYKFKNGALATVRKDISAYILMKTEHGEKRGKAFKIIAPYRK